MTDKSHIASTSPGFTHVDKAIAAMLIKRAPDNGNQDQGYSFKISGTVEGKTNPAAQISYPKAVEDYQGFIHRMQNNSIFKDGTAIGTRIIDGTTNYFINIPSSDMLRLQKRVNKETAIESAENLWKKG